MKIVKLSEVIPVTAIVEVAEGTAIELRPISLENIVELFWGFQDAFISLYAEGNNENPNFAALVAAAPELVATAIAYSAGEKDSVNAVKMLPATVQLIALTEVWKLSVPDVKKLKEVLVDLSKQIAKAKTDLAQTESVSKIETSLKVMSPKALESSSV